MIEITIAFIAGIGIGIIAAIVGGFAILRAPTRREVEPIRYCAVAGDGAMLHHNSSAHGATPHDWSGSVWNPPGSWRYIDVYPGISI